MTKSYTSRHSDKEQRLQQVLDGLMTQYVNRVPDAKKIFDACALKGDTIQNDHIAFRSLDCRPLLQIFLHYEYVVQFEDAQQTPMNFPDKKLTAVWLKHPNPLMPRIFISECRIDELRPKTQALIKKYAPQHDPIESIDLDDPHAVVTYLHTGQWDTPTYDDYVAIGDESEYMAWVLNNKYYLNHFTLTVNSLDSFGFQDEVRSILTSHKNTYNKAPKPERKEHLASCINDLQATYKRHMNAFNKWLTQKRFTLNAPRSHTLNISPDGLLLQSSTKAKIVACTFAHNNKQDIPGSYVEFAYRGLLATSVEAILNGTLAIDALKHTHYRDGFEVANATNIFESTYTRKTTTPQTPPSTEPSDAFNASVKRLHQFLKDS